MCNFGNVYLERLLQYQAIVTLLRCPTKGFCFTVHAINCESVFLSLSEQTRTIQFHFSGEEVRNKKLTVMIFFLMLIFESATGKYKSSFQQ